MVGFKTTLLPKNLGVLPVVDIASHISSRRANVGLGSDKTQSNRQTGRDVRVARPSHCARVPYKLGNHLVGHCRLQAVEHEAVDSRTPTGRMPLQFNQDEGIAGK